MIDIWNKSILHSELPTDKSLLTEEYILFVFEVI